MKLTRILLPLTLSLALGTVPAALRAGSGQTAHEAPAAEQHTTESHGPADHGQEASHEAVAEPAHEGGEAHHEGGQHGPAIKLFGMELSDAGQWGIQLINFFIFSAILFFVMKGPLAAAFKARTKELEERLAQAEKDKAEGEAQMKELEAKMAGLESELKGIMAKAEEDAEAEKVRVIDAAKTEAAAILAQASAEIGHQQKQAEQELRALVAELSVDAAAKRLEAQVQGGVATSAVDRAITHIGGIQ